MAREGFTLCKNKCLKTFKPHKNEGKLIPVHFHRIKQLWIRFFFFLKLLKIYFDLNRISLQTFFKSGTSKRIRDGKISNQIRASASIQNALTVSLREEDPSLRVSQRDRNDDKTDQKGFFGGKLNQN